MLLLVVGVTTDRWPMVVHLKQLLFEVVAKRHTGSSGRRGQLVTSDDPAPASGKVPPEQRVGAAMRKVRESAGMSLREMARRLGYNSHTTLSSHERGEVMPTDESVAGYERELGLRTGSLLDILEAARIERHGDAWPKRRRHLPVDFGDKDASADLSTQRSRLPQWARNRWLIGSVGLVAVGVIIWILVAVLQKPTPPVGVRDGSDPKVTGCLKDAIVSDSVDVYSPPEHLVGVYELRSSPLCGTSWGRFVPTSALLVNPPLTVEVDVHRPADNAINRFHAIYPGENQPVYGNMLISRNECVYAVLILTRKGQPSSAPIQTRCARAPGG